MVVNPSGEIQKQRYLDNYAKLSYFVMTGLALGFGWWFVDYLYVKSEVSAITSNRFTDRDAMGLRSDIDVKLHEITKLTEINIKLIHENAIAIAKMPKEIPPTWWVNQVNSKFAGIENRVGKLEDKVNGKP